MSVLIKGMKMPKNCEECDFCHWSNLHQTGRCDRCDDEPVCADFGTDYKRTRARFCPLVEVPTPHGRLVEFIDVVVTDDEDTGTQEINLGEVLSAYLKMRSAPAIIEAEVET